MRLWASSLHLLAIFSIVAIVLVAAEVAGKWKGTADTGTEIVLNLKPDGTKLTGTASLNGVEKPISAGKVENDRISFTMSSMYGGGTVSVKGKLDGVQLQLVLEGAMGTAKATLKRE